MHRTPLLDRIARREQNDERQHDSAQQRPSQPFVAPWRRKELERFERVGYVAVADLTPSS